MWLKNIVDFLIDREPRALPLYFDDDRQPLNCTFNKISDPSLPRGIYRYEVLQNGTVQTTFFLHERYQVGRLLGKGTYGFVFAGKDTKNSNAPVAIKSVTLYPHQRGNMLLREIRILSRVRHPFILPMLDVMDYRSLPCLPEEKGVLTFVVERMKHDLMSEIYKNRQQPLDIFRIKLLFTQMVRAVGHLHSNNIIHRDLKPENFLIGANNRVKLGDFGHARGIKRVMTRRFGTAVYLPPEIMLSKSSDKVCNYSPAVDMWAVGVILAEMLGHAGPDLALFDGLALRVDPVDPQASYVKEYLRVVPGPRRNDPMRYLDSYYVRQVVLAEVKARGPDTLQKFRAHFPSAPKEAIDLLEGLLRFDPDRRMNANCALNHPFLRDMSTCVLGGLLGLSIEEKRILRSGLSSGYDLNSEINEEEMLRADGPTTRRLLAEEGKKFHKWW